jgi:O-antigen/teichoic acid export membrane protein
MQEETEQIQVPIKKIEKNESLKKVVIRNSIFNFLTSLIARIGGLIFTIVIARLLQPELFGIYTLATSVMLILLTFADSGINVTMLRYIASAVSKKNEKLAASYFKYLLRIKTILTIIFAIILLIISYPLSFYVFKQPTLFFPLLICSIYLVVLSFIGFYTSLFYALQDAKYVSIQEAIWQIFRIALVILGIYLISNKVIGALGGVIVAITISLLFLIFLVFKRYSFLFEEAVEISKKEKKRMLRFLFFLTIGSITGAFFAYIDIIILGIFVKAEFIGFYRAAFSIVGGVAGLITVTNALLPLFTQLKGQKLENAFNKVFRYSAVLSFPAAFGLALIAKPFINVIYGGSYLLATIPLYILSFLIIESATGSLFTWLFAAKEKPEVATKILIWATLMNIILNFILILSLIRFGPIYAVLGASAATLISRYFNFVVLVKEANKKLKVKLNINSIIKPLIASIIMFFVLIMFQQATKFIWPLSIIEIIFAIAVYFVILLIIKGIRKEDLYPFKLLFKK